MHSFQIGVYNNLKLYFQHTGYWYIYPIEPLGQSTKLKLLEPWEASKTRLLDCSNNVAHSYGMVSTNIQSTLGSLKHFEISVPRHIRSIRVAEVRKTINRTTTFNKRICNLLFLDFHVKTATRISLRYKRLFEISEVEITRVD